MIRTLCFGLCLASLATTAQSQNFYFPPNIGHTWSMLTPSSQGFCPERVDSLYQFLADNDTKGFILLKDGKIVLEKYYGTFTQDSFWYWASAGKSLTAFLVGQAQDEGLLDIEDKTSDYLGTGWTTCNLDQESAITIWHQLTMSSGLDDGVPDDNCIDPSCLYFKAAAGTRWAYHNGVYHLLHDVIEQASGNTIQQFTKTRLLDKTGMKGLWVNHIQYGRTRDLARFGLLNLAGGVWNGDSLLKNRDYFNAMSVTSQPMNKSYGYLWWLNGEESFMLPGLQFAFPGTLVKNAPSDMYAALGKNDQKIHIVPSKGWVIVRLGNASGGGNALVPTVFDNDMWYYLNQLVCTSSTGESDLPNPIMKARWIAPQTIQIDADFAMKQVLLYDIAGRILVQEKLSGTSNHSLQTGFLAPGVYYLRVNSAQGNQIVKVYKD